MVKLRPTNSICISIFIFSLMLDSAFGKKPPAVKPPQAIKNALGNKVTTVPLDNTGFDTKAGQASGPSDLNCDFSAPCCWKNAQPPYGTVQWSKATGSPDAGKFKKNFAPPAPAGTYLLATMDKGNKSSDKAELQSCLIPCAGDAIKVTAKHWTSKGGPTIRICEVAQANPNELLACQDLPGQGPGPDTVTLPPGQNVFIAIDAYNFAGANGVAIIKDITVDYPATCADTTPITNGLPPTTKAPGPASIAECQKVACNFEKGMCGYIESNVGSGNFLLAGPNKFQNGATGVAKSPDVSHYAAAYLKPGQTASMEVTSNAFYDTDKQLRFQEYKATTGITTRACCDTVTGCPYETGGKVQRTDFRQWFQGAIRCPQGTKKIIFVAENKGDNEGGVGIDNIQVFDTDGVKQICT